MPARRRMQSSGRQPGRTNWGRLASPAWVTVAAATKVLFVPFLLDNPGISETIRRTRGRFGFHSDQGAGLEELSGAFGAVIVTDAAAAIGITAIPGPVTDASDDNWFLWESFMGNLSNNVGGNIASTNVPMVAFDSKAMRKVETGFQVAFVVENASATTGLNFIMSISLLSSRV